MNLIFCLTVLIAVSHINCDLPKIKVDIADDDDGFVLVTKALFAKLDWMIVEMDGITKRLNKQDENINQLPTKAEINELMKLSNKQEAEINEVMKLNQQVFQKLNQQDQRINQILLKVEINELVNTNITELNHQIFQKLNQQHENINQLPTKAELIEVMELPKKQEKQISEVLEFNQQLFHIIYFKMDLQEKLITKSSNDIEGLYTRINEMSANQSLLFQKSSKYIENLNVTTNKLLQNQLLHNELFNLQDKFVIKSTETVNKMLSKQPLKEMGNWLVILRRQDGSENFDRNWLDYQNGFGNPHGEFFVGLEKLHAITSNWGPHELLIILEDFEGNTTYAKYDDFVVGNDTEKYKLKKLGEYDGDAGDSMTNHVNNKFSTKDQDNDMRNNENCAATHKGGWWFISCFAAHLTGTYYHKPKLNGNKGIIWYHWHGWYYSLKFVEMMVRPKA